MPTIEELLALAAERAAMEVETWIPEKPGDRIAGEVIEIGTISTKFGDYYTTTIRLDIAADYVENGEKKAPKPESPYVRVAWMGAVLKAQFTRMQPRPTDVCAFHYQKDVPPASGMNDYALIVAAVIDPRTGFSKIPVMPDIHVPTETEIANADPRTGELRATVEPFPPDTEGVKLGIVPDANKGIAPSSKKDG